MDHIKNFRSFRLNEGISKESGDFTKGDYYDMMISKKLKEGLQEIKDEISDRLMELGESVKIDIRDNSYQYKDISLGVINIDFVIKNIVSSELVDIINSVRWIVGYSDSIGYDVELSAGNYNDFTKNSLFKHIGFFIYNCTHLMATDGLSNLDIIEEQLISFYEDLIKLDDELAAGYFLKIILKERK